MVMWGVILGLMPVSSSVTRLVRELFHVKHTGVNGLYALGGVGLVISVGIGAGDGVSPDFRSTDWLSVDCGSFIVLFSLDYHC